MVTSANKKDKERKSKVLMAFITATQAAGMASSHCVLYFRQAFLSTINIRQSLDKLELYYSKIL